jgi:tRNA(His) 5'-end guanylyltransferase
MAFEDDFLYFKTKEVESAQKIDLDYRRKWIIARVDGMRFHTFTRAFLKPYDPYLHYLINTSMLTVLKHEYKTNWKYAYFQSDEVSICFPLLHKEESEFPFGAKRDKIIATLLQINTIMQYYLFQDQLVSNRSLEKIWNVMIPILDKIPFPQKGRQREIQRPSHFFGFDCRVFECYEEDIGRYLTWRRRDAIRNSKSSIARCFVSQKQLSGLNATEQIELLESKHNFNYYTLPTCVKRGMFYINDLHQDDDIDHEFLEEDDLTRQFQEIILKTITENELK